MSEQKVRTYVLKFGLLPPVSAPPDRKSKSRAYASEEDVLNMIEAGHKYRNVLVEVEREHVRLIQEAEAKFGLDVLEDRKTVIEIQNKKEDEAEVAGKTVQQSKEAKAERKKRDAELKELKAKIREIRRTLSFRELLHEIDGRDIEPKPPRKKGEKKRSSAEARNKKKEPNNSIDGKARRAARAAAVENGLFWGTYLTVEAAMMASKKDVKGKKGPKFVARDGGGQLGMQIQKKENQPLFKGIDLFTKDDNKCSIKARPESWFQTRPTKPKRTTSIYEAKYSRESLAMEIRRHGLQSVCKAERRHAGRVRLCMQIGTREQTETKVRRGKEVSVTKPVPLIAEWPMIMHRDIPNDAYVQWIKVTRRRVGPDYVWSCDITLSEAVEVDKDTPRGVAAIVFGWRKRNNRVRVAEWLSPSGQSGALELLDLPMEPDRKIGLTAKDMRRSNLNRKDVDGGRGGVIDGMRLVAHLKKTRDNNFNVAREQFAQWMEQQKSLPEWMAKKTTKRGERLPTKKQAVAYVRQWEAQGKLASMVLMWRDNRIDGDADIFDELEKWRFHDRHLWKWERRQDLSARRRRKDVYRNFAFRLTDQFGMLLVDDTNFKALKEKKDGEEKLPGRNPTSMSQMVSPGELREIIAQTASRRDRIFEKRSASKSAQRCPKCGTTHKAHRDAAEGVFACSNCTFEDNVMHTRLLNMLAADGHESAVQRIIARMERAKSKLRHHVDADQFQPEA